jgi:hypothetical protein
MSLDSYEPQLTRASDALCVCPAPDTATSERGWTRLLALGFGLNVLAQALVLSQLPEASRLLAPSLDRIGWPFALLLIGAAAASMPSALLIDAFGRRAAFALGASFGIAGGALAAFGILHSQFPALCLGAAWLGLAQGFALFYRHAAAPSGGGLAVLGGGALAALAAPFAVELSVRFGGGAAMLGAALLYVASLALALRLPHAFAAPVEPDETFRLDLRFALATFAGAAAWLGMGAAMLHGPLSLTMCGAGASFVGGAMAWHLMAMYGPATLAARTPALFPPLRCIGLGLSALAIAYAIVVTSHSETIVAVAMGAIGAAWSLANIGALRLLHESRRSRAALALHDVCLLGAAAAGALL